MMAKILLFLLFLCNIMQTQSQSTWCGSRTDSGRYSLKLDTILEQHIHDQIKSNPIKWRSEKYIPVVVHVVTDDPQQFTYGEIVHQIDVLNKDFANRGENLVKLPDEFLPLIADTEIRFCLATTDPDGNPTNGVTYTSTDIPNIALARDFVSGMYILYYDQLGGRSGWDPERYINIWVAEFGNGILGYGSLPGTAPPEETGIVMDPLYFGAFGNEQAYFDRGHSLTHEMGHFLGLIHIWGDDAGCDGSDMVDDTPNAAGFYIGCPSGTHSSCGVSNMYQNFMDLTDDRCLAAFTRGQGERMQAILDLFYPDLFQPGACGPAITDFDVWRNELVWSYDQIADEYIVFHPQGFIRDVEVDIFSTDGRLVKTDLISGGHSYLIDLDAVPGVYFVRFRIEGRQYVKPIAVY